MLSGVLPEICNHQAPSPQKTDGKTRPLGEALWYQCSEQSPKRFQLSLNGPLFLSPTPETQTNPNWTSMSQTIQKWTNNSRKSTYITYIHAYMYVSTTSESLK